jgi:flagellar biosynthesis/type III secretory pathway ATPase
MNRRGTASSPRQGGRPSLDSEKLRHRFVTVRFNNDELAAIRSKASQAALPVATYLRDCGLTKRLSGNRFPKANLAHVGELNHLGRNLNQALVLMHTGRASPEFGPTLDQLLSLLEEIRQHLIQQRERSSDD